MWGRADRTRHPWPRQLLLLVVMVAATACAHSAGTDHASAPLSAQATETPPAATRGPGSSTPVAAATTPPEPTATDAAPPTMGAATPVRLQIPAIGVDSDLMDLGLQADGTLEVPSTGFPAGWYTGAPTPGELGPAIIAGHVDWGGQPGVFFDLRELSSGDEIDVLRQDGSTARFRVDRVERFAKEEFPTQLVYADLDHAGLRLITCDGVFDRQAHSYEDNLVVFASLVEGDPATEVGEAAGGPTPTSRS